MFENYSSTFWSRDIDGVEVKIGIEEIEKYLANEPVVEILVDDIKDLCIHKDKTDLETLKRVNASDLSYYIIICKKTNNEYGMILDGHHRLQKAINNGIKYIKCKILDLNKAPEKYKIMFQ
jgi:hypothetical protein